MATQMTDWSRLLTEQRNPDSERIDELDTIELVRLINQQDALVPAAVEAVLIDVAAAVDLVTTLMAIPGKSGQERDVATAITARTFHPR